MSRNYTPAEVAIIVLKKAEELTKSAMGGLKPTTPAPVPGVVSPTNLNSASPMKVGSQAVVKTAKPKKMAGALDKPSKFFKSEEFKGIKKPSVENLRAFLEKQRSKKKV